MQSDMVQIRKEPNLDLIDADNSQEEVLPKFRFRGS